MGPLFASSGSDKGPQGKPADPTKKIDVQTPLIFETILVTLSWLVAVVS